MAIALADLGAREVGVVAAEVYHHTLRPGACARETLSGAERAGVVRVPTGQSVEVVLLVPRKLDPVASFRGKADRPVARIVVVNFDGLGWHRQADAASVRCCSSVNGGGQRSRRAADIGGPRRFREGGALPADSECPKGLALSYFFGSSLFGVTSSPLPAPTHRAPHLALSKLSADRRPRAERAGMFVGAFIGSPLL